MPIRLGFLLLTTFFGIAVGAEVLTQTPNMPQLAIRYLDEADKEKVLAYHTLTFSTEGKIDFTSGGELPHRQDESALDFGTQINGEVTRIDQQSYRLDITMQLGTPVVAKKRGQEPNWLTRQFIGGMLMASRSRILAHRHVARLERLSDATSTASRCCRTVLSCTEPR